jgi:DNA-binding winged helix-turn-helix (wHTH) protein
MQRRHQRAHSHQIARHRSPSRWAVINTSTSPLRDDVKRSTFATAEAALEFGRFRVLLRQRQLLADGLPVELGTRAFDLLVVLLEAEGSLVSKEELLSRAWPGIVVSEENLKVQISTLRKALGADRDVIHTEFGRGYRFTAPLRSNVELEECQRLPRPKLWSSRTLFQQNCRRSYRGRLDSN